jgi:predicted ATP-binding protein involved in virulence
MEDIFISKIHINKVRHLENVEIILSETERKHLILTGKNGSGKTSLLEEIKFYLSLNFDSPSGVTIDLTNTKLLHIDIPNGYFIVGYFSAIRSNIKRILKEPNGPQKIETSHYYAFDDKANADFLQLLINYRYDAIEHIVDNNKVEAEKINKWFSEITDKLGELYGDENLALKFDKSNYNYSIVLSDNRRFDFKQLSDGYSSIIDIISEILMRMENKVQKVYDLQGIVLIDEIETHLHIDLQKKILPFLTSFFPKIQFIVTTHSPFVLSSIDNAVIFDLETKQRVEDLSGYSVEGIVESYFDIDQYSEEIKAKLDEYESLLNKSDLTNDEKERKLDLKMYFKNNIAKTLSPELSLRIKELETEKMLAQ